MCIRVYDRVHLDLDPLHACAVHRQAPDDVRDLRRGRGDGLRVSASLPRAVLPEESLVPPAVGLAPGAQRAVHLCDVVLGGAFACDRLEEPAPDTSRAR